MLFGNKFNFWKSLNKLSWTEFILDENIIWSLANPPKRVFIIQIYINIQMLISNIIRNPITKKLTQPTLQMYKWCYQYNPIPEGLLNRCPMQPVFVLTSNRISALSLSITLRLSVYVWVCICAESRIWMHKYEPVIKSFPCDDKAIGYDAKIFSAWPVFNLRVLAINEEDQLWLTTIPATANPLIIIDPPRCPLYRQSLWLTSACSHHLGMISSADDCIPHTNHILDRECIFSYCVKRVCFCLQFGIPYICRVCVNIFTWGFVACWA